MVYVYLFDVKCYHSDYSYFTHTRTFTGLSIVHPLFTLIFYTKLTLLGQESTGITAPALSRPTTKEGWESLLDTCVGHYGKDFGYIILTLTYFYKLCYINLLLTHICYSIFTLNFSKLFKSHPHEPIVVFLY